MHPSFITSSASLLKQLERIKGAVGGSPDMPILGCVLLDLRESELRLTATNLDIRLETSLDVEGRGEGRLAVPAAKLLALLSNMPAVPTTFTLDLDTHALDIKGAGKYRLACEDAGGFPRTPAFEAVTEHELPAGWLQRGLSKTVGLADDSTQAPEWAAGLHIRSWEKSLDFAASNGYGLIGRYRQRRPEGASADDHQAVVPARAMRVLAGLLPKSMAATRLATSESHFMVDADGLLFSCRLRDSNYPQVGQGLVTVAKNNTNKVLVGREELTTALRRLTGFVDDKRHAVTLTVGPVGVSLAASDFDGSNAAEDFVPAQTGAALTISLRLKSFIDALGDFDSSRVCLNLGTEATHHCLLTPGDPNEGEHLEILLAAVAA